MIRRAGPRDLDAIVKMRIEMWNELNPGDPSDAPFEQRVRAYYAGVLGGPGVLVWLAEDAGAVVGMVTLLVHQHPPRKDDPEVRGYVTAMYVVPDARQQGHARRLIETVVEHGRGRKMRRLILRTTEAARHLYGTAGFAPLEHLAIDLT